MPTDPTQADAIVMSSYLGFRDKAVGLAVPEIGLDLGSSTPPVIPLRGVGGAHAGRLEFDASPERLLKIRSAQSAAGQPGLDLPGPPSEESLVGWSQEYWPFQPADTLAVPDPAIPSVASALQEANSKLLTLCIRHDPSLSDWPLEWLPIRNKTPACIEPNTLVVRHDPAKPGLVPTDKLRVLVTWNNPEGGDERSLGDWPTKLEGAVRNSCPQHVNTVKVLVDPTWPEVRRELENEDAEYNVVCIAGHVEARKSVDGGIDGAGWQTFRGFKKGVPPQDQPENCIDAATLAEAIRSTGRVQVAALLGCATWTRLCDRLQSDLGAVVAESGARDLSSNDATPEPDASRIASAIPFVIGTRHEIHLSRGLRDGIESFLSLLASTRSVDRALLALRTKMNGTAPEGAALISQLHGGNLELIAAGAAAIRINYARHVLNTLPDLTLPNMLTEDQRRSQRQRWRAYISRHVQYQVLAPKPDREMMPGGESEGPSGRQRQPEQERWQSKTEPESWLRDALFKPDARVQTIGVEATAGMGKTSLLKSLARELALAVLNDPLNTALPLPAFYELRDNPGATVGGLLQKLGQQLQGAGACKFVLLLDGLDEFPGNPKQLMDGTVNDCVTVVSSRPEQARSSGLVHFSEIAGGRQHILSLERLRRHEVIQYIRAHFQNGAHAQPTSASGKAEELERMLTSTPSLADVVQEPLLLALLCMLYETGNLPNQKEEEIDTATQLIGHGINVMMLRRNKVTQRVDNEHRELEKPPSKRILSEHLNIIAAIAFQETLRATSYSEDPDFSADIPETDALRVVKSVVQDHQRTKEALELRGQSLNPYDQLHLILESSGLVAKVAHSRGTHELEFRYRIRDVRVREYLTAFHLNRLINEHGWHYVDHNRRPMKVVDTETGHSADVTPCIYDPWKFRG